MKWNGPASPRRRLAFIGDVMMDIHLILPLESAADEKVHAVHSLRAVGGTAANAAASARSLGSDITLYATVGTDAFAQWVLHHLEVSGLGHDGIHQTDGNTGIAVITHRGSQRSVIIDRGVAGSLEHLDTKRIGAEAAVVYLTGVSPATVRAVQTQTRGLVVVSCEAWQLDEEFGAWMNVLPDAQVMLGNAAIGESRITAIRAGAPALTVIITDGAAGAMVYAPRQSPVSAPAPTVEVVDASGAGDCFAGTLCHYLAGGAETTAAVENAVLAASASTMCLGAQGGLPTLESLGTMRSGRPK